MTAARANIARQQAMAVQVQREITRLRDHNIALFSLLVSTHSLASTLLLKLLSSQSPESSKLVARFEELGAKIEEVTR